MSLRLARRGGESQSAASTSAKFDSPARLNLLQEIEDVGVGSFWATNKDGVLVYLSEKALQSLGKGGVTLLGQQLGTAFADASIDEDLSSNRSIAFRLGSRSKIENQIVAINLPEEGKNSERATRWWRISGRPFLDKKGKFQGYRGDSTDITNEFRQQQSIARQSQFDELTGLANRRRLNHQLTATVNSLKVTGRSCALMMLDLDRFKQVNDTMGHPAGDELLKQVAERLKTIVKDQGEVGRLGGDEFQILLPDMDDRGALSDLASRIIQMVSQPYSINGRRAIIGTSIGVAIAPYDGLDAAELNGAVDLALYAAKADGRGISRFYISELRDSASQGALIEEDLRDALHRGELSLKYQPLVDPKENVIKACEALMRWEREEGKEIPPSIFIPIAEQTDLILGLGEWALRQACMDAVQWPDQLRVAVNVSARQFINADFPKVVVSALTSSGLHPSRLELEITESVFVGDVEEVDKTFATLKRLGVRLALDDFGTGYSSLGYLKRAHFDKIKIDQSFVRGCTESGDTNPAIISAIVALAKVLGMETVAEGVEAMDELNLVKDRGADLVQGYIFSRPLKHEELLKRISEGATIFQPSGPARYRSDRISVYRKIGLIHEDHYYVVILRNLSKTGARIEGLGGVPAGTEVVLDLGAGQLVVGQVVQTSEMSQGLRFETKLISDGSGGLMTRQRISPYSLAEAGMPLAALGPGTQTLARWRTDNAKQPKFLQMDI